jgi:hypothetical protein
MKYLFIVTYFVISTYPAPCPSNIRGCLVYHGVITDTTRVEVITTDSSEVSNLLKSAPEAKIDTFLLLPYSRKLLSNHKILKHGIQKR